MEKLQSIAHLTDAQKEEVGKKLASAQELIDGVKADAEKPKHEDPKYTLREIIAKLDSTRKDTEAIFNLPPPKPEEPAGEKKEAETAPAAEDAEMKDEQPAEEKKAE